MGRNVDILLAPPALTTPLSNIPQGDNILDNRVIKNNEKPEGLDMVPVQRIQDADQVPRQARQDNVRVQDNITNIVECVLVQNGLNIGLHSPNYIFALSEYVRQTKLSRCWKVPKFTKFVGDTSESIFEHVVRYQTEDG